MPYALHTHAIIVFVATGHVLIIDAATRTPVFVVDVGVQAHAAVLSPDESYILMANQNGKLLQRINTNYATNTFILDDAPRWTSPTGRRRVEPLWSSMILPEVGRQRAHLGAAGHHRRAGVRHAPRRRSVCRQPACNPDDDRR